MDHIVGCACGPRHRHAVRVCVTQGARPRILHHHHQLFPARGVVPNVSHDVALCSVHHIHRPLHHAPEHGDLCTHMRLAECRLHHHVANEDARPSSCGAAVVCVLCELCGLCVYHVGCEYGAE